ncbi:retrovirus-related pol polyprotein from transposon TNT 1-94 [Tanacetum coccineum]
MVSCNLEIVIHSGKGLTDVKHFGTMDPYVLVWLTGENEQSSPVHKTQTARKGAACSVWNSRVKINIPSKFTSYTLFCEIKHDGTFFDRDIGQVQVRLRDLLAGGFSGENVTYPVKTSSGEIGGKSSSHIRYRLWLPKQFSLWPKWLSKQLRSCLASIWVKGLNDGCRVIESYKWYHSSGLRVLWLTRIDQEKVFVVRFPGRSRMQVGVDSKGFFEFFDCSGSRQGVEDLKEHGLAAALEELLVATIVVYDNVILKKAYSALILCLGDRVLQEITKETTTARIWKKLETLYMTKSLANRLYLKKRLYTFNMHLGKSQSYHIDEFHKLVGDSAAIDTAILDEDQAL